LRPHLAFELLSWALVRNVRARELRGTWNVGSGQAECVAVARGRSCLLLTNDRKVEKIANALPIDHLSLPLLPRELWRSRVMPKGKVAQLLGETESKDKVVIRNGELIFG